MLCWLIQNEFSFFCLPFTSTSLHPHALFMNEEGFYEVDLYHCKGCGICVRECAKGAIEMVEEGE